MEVVKLETLDNNYYQYKVILKKTSITLRDDILQWLDENSLGCSVIYDSVYFHTHKDAMLFVLRWS